MDIELSKNIFDELVKLEDRIEIDCEDHIISPEEFREMFFG